MVNWNRHGVLSALSFTDNNGVGCFDQSPLRKTADIVEGSRRNARQNRKGPAPAGLFSYPGTEDGRTRPCNVRRCRTGLS